MAEYYYSGTSCINSGATLTFKNPTPVPLPIVVNRDEKPGCYTLTNELLTPGGSVLISFNSTFPDCQECLTENYCVVVFSDCKTSEIFYVSISSITQLPFIPQVNYVYSAILANNSPEPINYFQSCFIIVDYQALPCEKKVDWKLISISPSSFGLDSLLTCETCRQSLPAYYQVYECVSNTIYIISLPPGTNYTSYAITFTIDTLGIDLYCGIIGATTTNPIPTAFISSIIGYVGEGSGTEPGQFCTECVASGNTKVAIRNCLDGYTEVIWSSNLFNPGDVSNISLGGGQCYEILSATTADVTINELLNYEPSPTCTDCLNCEQVLLTIVGVNDFCDTSIGRQINIISNQYVPFGTIIFYQGSCYQVIDVQPVGPLADQVLVSFPSFEICQDCLDSSFQTWVATSCSDDHWDYITLTGTTSLVPGQIVQVLRNGSEFTCYTLQFQGLPEEEIPNTPNYYFSETTVPFNTCEECTSGSTVGITIIDCDYSSASYITVTLYDYLRLTGGDGNPATPVIQYDGKCHLLLNECPIDNIYPFVTSNLYNNCIECSADLSVTRYSGTTCFSQENIIVSYLETNILTPGDIVITNGGTCVTISGTTDLTEQEDTISLTGLTSCYECYLNDNPNYHVVFQQCLTNEIYFIPLSDIGFLPTLGQVYFLDFVYGEKPHQTCFTVIGLEPSSFDDKMVFNSISVPYVDCEECYTNNLIRYIVRDCVSGEMHVIGYPTIGLVNLVTYTPIGEVDQYCGSIEGITEADPIDSSLITILGKVPCDDCLAAVAKKRILTNCLTGNEVVVWGSLLFDEGNITHIQTGEGCYEVGPETELEVTLNEFLDFDNYPSCQECIQCNGVHYFWSACTPSFDVVSIATYDNSFSNPRFLQFDQTNNILWITVNNDTQIQKIDVLTGSVLATYTPVSQVTQFFFLHPTNGFIYYQNSGNLFKFNTTTGVSSLVSTYGNGYTLFNYFYDSTTNYLWLTVFTAGRIYVFDLTSETIVSPTILLSTSYPSGIVLNTSSNKIYVTDFFYGWYYIIDRTTLNLDNSFNSFMFNDYKLIYDSVTNRIFGNNHFIDCNINQVFYGTNNIYTDVIKDPISGKLIVPNGGIYIFDPIYLTLSSVQTPLPYGSYQFVQYNSVTNEYYFATIYGNSIINVTFGVVYNIGEIDSYKYAPLNSYFFHPKYGCSVIYDILPSSGITSHNFYSFETFDTCEDCTATSYVVWGAYNCVTGQFGYVVTTSGSYNPDDLVNVKWGETDFICFTLRYIIPPSEYQDINLNRDFYFADGVVKPTCENCSDGTSVSISIIDCSNQNSMFVNVSLSLWFILTGYNDTIPRPVFLFGDTCYKVLNECPFSPNFYPINPSYIYYNCESCGNPLEANSETVLCLQNCSGSTYTVSVNHPYWTNQYGMAVIQNNAVGLGGQTGYNA